MTIVRAFSLFAASLSVIMLSNFAAPAQSRNRKRAVAKPAAIAVTEINAKSLSALLKRDAEDPRPLLVNFWATWCDPCREEFPDLVEIDRQYRRKGLDFIAISLDDVSDIKTEVPKFLRQMRATMPSYLLNAPDPETAINAVDPTWSGALPATFLYNSQGEVVFKHFGRIKPLELRAAIDKVISNK